MALRRDSTIHLSEDVVDANGLALFIPESGSSLPANDDSTIAPWLDEPVRDDWAYSAKKNKDEMADFFLPVFLFHV